MRYKKSKYNVITRYNDLHIIANVLKGTLVSLREAEYKLFCAVDGEKEFSDNEALLANMCDVGIVVPVDFDELKYFQYFYWKLKEDKSFLNITVNPSFLCNMKCQYCYQHNQNQNLIISKEVLQKIYEFINNKIDRNTKKMFLNWCGGEATITLDYYYEFAVQVRNLCTEKGIEFKSAFSTNAYELNLKNIEKLCEMGVTDIQTTLAGFRDDHDMLRPTKSGQPTYDRIIENIKMAKDHFKSIIIVVNLTTNNVMHINKMLDSLKENGLFGNVFVVFKRILPYGNKALESLCLTPKEFNEISIAASKYAIKLGLTLGNMSNFQPSFLNCYSGHANTYTFDSNGKMYKCIERNDMENQIGELDKSGNLIMKKQDLHTSFDVCTDRKCRECVMLPSCGGGCISRRIEGEDFCEDFIENVEDYLLLYYLYKTSCL